jgi:two-component system sensor histidine kinase PilS (NtrC family)
MLSGLVTADMDGRVLTFNRAAATITGLSAAQAIGHDVGEVLQLPVPFRRRLQTLGETRSQRADHQYRSPDGRLLDIGLTVTTLQLPDGRSGCLFTFQDVTDVRRLERGSPPSAKWRQASRTRSETLWRPCLDRSRSFDRSFRSAKSRRS